MLSDYLPSARATRRSFCAAATVGALFLSGCASVDKRADDNRSLESAISAGLGAITGRGAPKRGPSISGEFFDRASGERFMVASFSALPGWENDDHASAFAAFRESCKRILGLKRAEPVGGAVTTLRDWKEVCAHAMRAAPNQARGFFEALFTPVRIAPEKPAKFTSYYYPELPARLKPDAVFKYPIYRRPPELVNRGGKWGREVNGRITPYPSRGDVYHGALAGRGLEIAYLADPVELMFMQIQGSGRLRLADGRVLSVGYAGKSGHKFRSVARLMMRRGLSTSGSKADMVAYVKRNPSAGLDLLSYNESYIFFEVKRDLDPRLGPIGALGVQLSDLRSIAVDKNYTPLGAPVWVEGPAPGGYFRQLMIAQDVGSAINGPQRADIYWGTGDRAGRFAKQVNHRKGRLTVLLPTSAVARRLAGTS